MMRRALTARKGTVTYFAHEEPEIMGTAMLIRPVGRTHVFVRPPGGHGRIKTTEKFYRVWSEITGNMMMIGRLYANGKFSPLKTQRAEETMRTPGWRKALLEMQEAVLIHRVMTE